jgi:hypothetical protein
MINNDYLTVLAAAHQQIDRLHAESAEARMIREYRAAHPRQRLRPWLAGGLRRVADRLAPDSKPTPAVASRRAKPLPTVAR